ncbi:MAG TPA: heavy metal-associated domain-containing protein [Candidatus Limnocylindria bacterium]|jgi:copper chaperone CopZ|nr:heavy metal-associated domain-containing protein [Candidatus Limnocylindria bacterium]
MTQTIRVQGMTCENCVRHVTEALAEIPGVRSAQVDLAEGTARLQVDAEIAAPELARVLDDAGYALAS